MANTIERASSGASCEVSAVDAASGSAGGEEPSEPAGGAPEPPERPTPPAVDVSVRAGVAIDAGWLASRLSAAAGHLAPPPARLAVLVTDDAGMSDLHRRHRRTAEATDVLAFPANDAGEAVEVDVAINADEARRQASARGHRVERELLLYALHGVLHCMGFDDHAREDAAAMHGEEDRILRAIGVGATFAPEAAPDPAESEETR